SVRPRAPDPDRRGVVAGRAAVAPAPRPVAEELEGSRQRGGRLAGLGLLAEDLNGLSGAPARRSTLGLRPGLRGGGGVAGPRRRRGVVRLGDVAVRARA